MGDLSHCPVVVVVFAMDGCHHCHEYLPRFHKQISKFQAYQWPFVYYDGTRSPARGEIPIVILDGASQDPGIDALAQKYAVEGMPTTLIMPRWGEAMKYEGAIEDAELYEALVFACNSRR